MIALLARRVEERIRSVQALAAHGRDDRPGAMGVVLDKFRADVDAGVSRHYAMVKALGFGYRDAIAGYYSAWRLTEELSEAFHAA